MEENLGSFANFPSKTLAIPNPAYYIYVIVAGKLLNSTSCLVKAGLEVMFLEETAGHLGLYMG